MNKKSKTGLTDKFRPPATKVCRLCKHEKPTKDFARNVRGRSGYANECRACNREQEIKKTEQQKEQAKTFFDARFFTLAFLLSTSLTAFSQDKPEKLYLWPDGKWSVLDPGPPVSIPDTLRALILVTLSPNGIAHARMGFVVIAQGNRPVYLDCRKKALKGKRVGWGYELITDQKVK